MQSKVQSIHLVNILSLMPRLADSMPRLRFQRRLGPGEALAQRLETGRSCLSGRHRRAEKGDIDRADRFSSKFEGQGDGADVLFNQPDRQRVTAPMDFLKPTINVV